MKKKHLIMIMVGMFVCGLCLSGYMLKNGFAKADEAPVAEVQIDDGFVVVIDNNAQSIDSFNNQVQVSPVEDDEIVEAEVINDATVEATETPESTEAP